MEENESDSIISTQLEESNENTEISLDYMISLKLFLEMEYNTLHNINATDRIDNDEYYVSQLFNYLKEINVPNDKIRESINLLYENSNPDKKEEVNIIINRLISSSNFMGNLSQLFTQLSNYRLPTDIYTMEVINPHDIINVFTTNINTYYDQLPIQLNMQFTIPNNLILPQLTDINVMTKDMLDTITKIDLFKNLTDEIKNNFNTCHICLDEFTQEIKVRQLKCNHIFHIDCIDTWLLKENYKCPVCRSSFNRI